MWEAKIECQGEVKFDGSRLSGMTATGIGVLVEESAPGREMESIRVTSVLRRRAPAGVEERVKEGDGVMDVSVSRRRECQAGIGELAMENVSTRKAESIGDASVLRRKSRASVEVGELVGENTSIKKMESGSEHVKEEEESDGRNRKACRGRRKRNGSRNGRICQ